VENPLSLPKGLALRIEVAAEASPFLRWHSLLWQQQQQQQHSLRWQQHH
jgi:hypothetical protein